MTRIPTRDGAPLWSARDSGNATITSKIKLVQEFDKDIQAGTIMHLPVYKIGVPHDTLAQRRANILGWVSAVFRMNDLMRGILGERSTDLAIEIYDGEEISEQTLMYKSGNNRHTDAKPHSQFKSIKHVVIAGHSWTIVGSSLSEFDAKLNKDKSRLIGYAGIGIAILLALFTWLLVRGRARALQAAREVSRELTERKRLENELRHTIQQQHARKEELRESEEKYRDLFDNANDLLYTTDLKGIFNSVNNEMFTVLGYAKEELIGQPISKILRQSPLEVARAQMEAKINGVVPHTNYNLEVRACDGHMIPLELNSRLIYQSGQPTGIQGIARDVSEQLGREAELRTANQRAEEATRAKSRFLAAAGHDLRQPLAAANLFIGTLKFTKLSASQSEIVGRLEGAMSNFNGLLNALLNISKLESGVIEPEYGSVAVADMALWLKQIATPMAEKSGIALKLHFPVQNFVVFSDVNLVKQVLSNLVSNAFNTPLKVPLW